MTLISLRQMGTRWYAGVKDGNLTIGSMFGAPTSFPSTMSKEEVLAAIKRATPEIEIAPDVAQ